jgi:hypothetical protein
MNDDWPTMPDKPKDKGGPGDHYPTERSISGRACLPVLIAMIGIVVVLVSAIAGLVANYA